MNDTMNGGSDALFAQLGDLRMTGAQNSDAMIERIVSACEAEIAESLRLPVNDNGTDAREPATDPIVASSSPLTPHGKRNGNTSSTGRRYASTERASRKVLRDRLMLWGEASKSSGFPLINELLTVNLDMDEPHPVSIASQRLLLLEHLRKFYQHRGCTWTAIWAIEKDRWPHIHILLHVPDDDAFRRAFATWLVRRCGCMPFSGTSALQSIRVRNSGLPVNMRAISDSITYKGTGRAGFWGALDYIAKSATTTQRRSSKLTGKAVGASENITSVAAQLLAARIAA